MVRAFVCGCAGLTLEPAEREFLAETQPWGLILFRRNVDTPDQLRHLTRSFRDVVGRPDAPVLVDQEGGRVQRLTQPHWARYPSAARIGQAYAADRAAGIRLARWGGELVARDLSDCGITIDCAPVLDVPQEGSSDVIGDRAFGRDPDSIASLGRAFAEGLMAGGALPVMKHCPGHGRAEVDSHLELPTVSADVAALARDFAPFKALADLPIAMTAHVTYLALDPERPATTSRIVIERIIRGEIGFDGLLLSDDLSMEALKGSLGTRAANAFSAGCDIALHCNGVMEEARQVAAVAPRLDGRAASRAESALRRLTAPAPRDVVADRSAFFAEIAAAAA